ncbi:hypothetical protein D3C85_1457700 [compost metagenome]
MIEWKKEEIARINSIASCAALAEKFDVSVRCIEHISSYRSRRAPTEGLDYFAAKTEEAKKNISSAKIAQDNSAAGEFTKRTGMPAIDAIRERAALYTATEVANYIGWASVTSMRSWMKLRGYEVAFRKHKPVPPRRNGWGPINLRAASHG